MLRLYEACARGLVGEVEGDLPRSRRAIAGSVGGYLLSKLAIVRRPDDLAECRPYGVLLRNLVGRARALKALIRSRKSADRVTSWRTGSMSSNRSGREVR